MDSVQGHVTLALAALGAVLGIINTAVAINGRRVRLKVVAKYASINTLGGRQRIGCIEVTNLSDFPVHVSEIGFELLDSDGQVPIFRPFTEDNQPFARKLDRGASASGYFDLSRVGVASAGRCYARTESGEQFFGNRLR